VWCEDLPIIRGESAVQVTWRVRGPRPELYWALTRFYRLRGDGPRLSVPCAGGTVPRGNQACDPPGELRVEFELNISRNPRAGGAHRLMLRVKLSAICGYFVPPGRPFERLRGVASAASVEPVYGLAANGQMNRIPVRPPYRQRPYSCTGI
jgi:hypothetical protein